MGGDSRSDLQALQRSGRAKVVALALLMTGALAAAAWLLLLKPHGEGALERSDKVLIVRGDQVAGYSGALGRMGFDAAEGTLPHWRDKTLAELPDFEGSAVQGVVALADHYGYGFVAFEHPQEVDFADLDLEAVPVFEEHVRFAVVSIGDFAFPHRVTVNAPLPPALRRLELPLLDALFLQEELAKTLPGSEVNDIDVLQRRSQLERAITMLELREGADALAEKVERGWTDAIEPQGAVSTLGVHGLETAFAHPLPDGRIFTAIEPFEVMTRDGVRADLERAGQQQIFVGRGPGQSSGPERTLCAAFSGGTLPTAAWFTFSPHAGALVVRDDEASTLWRWDPAAPCGYAAAGTWGIDLSADALALDEAGHIAFVRTHAGSRELWVGRAEAEGAGTPRRIAELGESSATAPVWLDGEHVAVALSAADQAPTLEVFSVAENGARFEVALGTFAATVQSVVHAGPDALLLTLVQPGETSGGAALWRIEAPQPWAALLQPETTEGGDGETPHVQWSAEAWQLRPLTHGGHAREVVVSPDGTRAAFVWSASSGPGEVVVTDAVQSAPLLKLTADALVDRSPYFDATGKRLVFQTRRSVPNTAWMVSVPRTVAVPRK